MVGAQKSNRCDTCRKRKIKCDEDWPVCGQCKRSNRTCPPRSALKVVDEGVKLRSTGSSSDGEDGSSNTSLVVPHVNRRGKSPRVNSPISLPLTPAEQLAFDLVDSLKADDKSYSLNVIGEFVRDVPRHIGRSEALDSVTACMLVTHKHILSGRPNNWQIHPRLYSTALQNVRCALVDPQNWASAVTLCATVLLHRIEALYGILPNTNIEVHAAGLAALHRKRGPPKSGDRLDIQATVDSHISIIQHAINEHEDCFLASPKWAVVLDERNGRSDVQMIYYRLVRLMTLWPTLVRENSALRKGDLTIDREVALEKCLHVLEELSHIGCEVDDLLDSEKFIKVKPTTNKLDFVPMMFDVKDRLAAMLVAHYAMYSVIVHRLVLSHLRVLRRRHDTGLMEQELLRQCRRIWMLTEYSLAYKPMGLPIMSAILLLTYDLAEGPAAQDRIIGIVHELDDFRSMERFIDADKIRRGIAPLIGM
ncbi:uncharacterized protein F4822DRAFT_351614 [Hypoxylon trugodes]|uniref:uncharacterized protein n=1 Tax=Hypoxylon trugodes TaxID=326681 RepID=UPI0021A07A14|nr:uncharacterized protein F4822DRAFT_351614 [Hypoxylon trugodes]KAI1385700.1 hypothetical protein F4822DRAFT_351614 [Hypoxylon trugodes]